MAWQRYEEEYGNLYAVFTTSDTGIIHAVTALIAVESSLTGFPTRIPNGFAVLDIEVTTTSIHGNTVIAVARDTAELGILVEIVTTCSI